MSLDKNGDPQGAAIQMILMICRDGVIQPPFFQVGSSHMFFCLVSLVSWASKCVSTSSQSVGSCVLSALFTERVICCPDNSLSFLVHVCTDSKACVCYPPSCLPLHSRSLMLLHSQSDTQQDTPTRADVQADRHTASQGLEHCRVRCLLIAHAQAIVIPTKQVYHLHVCCVPFPCFRLYQCICYSLFPSLLAISVTPQLMDNGTVHLNASAMQFMGHTSEVPLDRYTNLMILNRDLIS